MDRRLADTFMHRHARALDLARWEYHFGGGSRESVLRELAYYQNEDGGFGHGLEADCWNPASTPIQTWCATEILREIGWDDAQHPLVQGILRYLDSGADFDAAQNQWLNDVPGNNDHPHAVWWTYGPEGSSFDYNPTACLAGFAVRYAEKDSPLQVRALRIAREAVAWLEARLPQRDEHVTSCFMRLETYLPQGPERERLHGLLHRQIAWHFEQNHDRWGKEYCALPTWFIDAPDSPHYAAYAPAVAQTLQILRDTCLPDGAWDIPWTWCNDDPAWQVARVWWQGT